VLRQRNPVSGGVNIFTDISNSEALSALDLNSSSSFSEAVAAYNKLTGDNISLEEAKEALGGKQADPNR